MNAFLLALILFSPIVHASEDCNHILTDRIESSIQNLAKLRYDLDTQIAGGESNMLSRTMVIAFEEKYLELSKVVKDLDLQLKEHVTKIQSEEKIVVEDLKILRQQQEASIQVKVIDIVNLDPILEPRLNAAIIQVSPHQVLVAGGLVNPSSTTSFRSSIELYDVKSGKSEVVGRLSDARSGLRLTQLSDGKVLAWGGYKANKKFYKIEIIDPALKTVTPLNHQLLRDFDFYLLPSNKIFQLNQNGFSTFDWVTGKKVAGKLPSLMKNPHVSHSQLPDGSIILTGSISSEYTQVLRIDGITRKVTDVGTIDELFFDQKQITLNDHQILISDSSETSSKVMMFDLDTRKTTLLGNLLAPRRNYQSVLLPGRRILILGGFASDDTLLHSVEIFDIDGAESFYLGEMKAGGSDFATTLTSEGVVISGTEYPMTLELIRWRTP